MTKLERIRLLDRLINNCKFQVLITISATLLLCIIHWLAAGRLVVKEMEIHLTHTHSQILDKHSQTGRTRELSVALLTDLHGGASVYRDDIAHVVDKTNSLGADLVLIVGDAIDAPREMIEERMEPLRHLRARLGVYYTTGNHEYYYGDVAEWIELFKAYGIRTLLNERVDIDGAICLVGLNDQSAWKSGIHSNEMHALGDCPLNDPVVVLAHNPAAADKIIEYGAGLNRTVDLILSGHTHAGQYVVIVPYVYWLLPYFYGIYDLNGGETKLLVSAGTLYQGSPMKTPMMSEIWLLRLKY